jgi:hypothetical protein
MSKRIYSLANPRIAGSIEQEYSVSSKDKNPALTAAHQFWEALTSSGVTNNVPTFPFTLQEGGNLHHFIVREKPDNVLEYDISEIELNLSADDKQKLLSEGSNAIDKVQTSIQNGGAKKTKAKKPKAKKELRQDGGKNNHRKHRYDDDSDSSDSSDDEDDYIHRIRIRRAMQPITYWWYSPMVYKSVINTTFIPTFVAPLYPYVHVHIPFP